MERDIKESLAYSKESLAYSKETNAIVKQQPENPPTQSQNNLTQPDNTPKTDTENEDKNKNKKVRDWHTKLLLRSPATYAMYKTYINKFIKKNGSNSHFTQSIVDDYFVDVDKEDKKQAKKH